MAKGFGRIGPMWVYITMMLMLGTCIWATCSIAFLICLVVAQPFFRVSIPIGTQEIFFVVGGVVILSIGYLYFEKLRVALWFVKRGLTWKESEFAVFGMTLHEHYPFKDMSLIEIRALVASWR